MKHPQVLALDWSDFNCGALCCSDRHQMGRQGSYQSSFSIAGQENNLPFTT